jgi:two-component system LytT family response regulator
MIKAIHIEDEPGVVTLLKTLLSTHFHDEIELCGNASSPNEAIDLIKATGPQLVFLDIELRQGNAFDLLEKLDDVKFEIIFITAYNNFALRAFKHSAIDYLLKPIDTDEFNAAINKALGRIENLDSKKRYSDLLKHLKEGFGTHKIGLPVVDGLLFINADDIIHAEAKGSYTVISLEDKSKVTIIKNLKDIEILLPASSFLRVHHSWIINLKHIKKYFKGKNSYMEMDDGSTVAISIRKKGVFLELFGG